MKDDIRKCEVCNSVEKVYVANSACGPISLAYCGNCLKNHYEPYKLLVVYLSCAGISNYNELQGSYKKLVDINLEFHKKTINDFTNDLIEEERIQEEYWANYEDESVAGLSNLTEL